MTKLKEQKLPIKVIQLNACNGLFGGIEALLLNIYRYIDKEKIVFDFLTCGKTTYDLYQNEILSMQGSINEIPLDKKNLKEYCKLFIHLYYYFKKSEANIVHINSSSYAIQLIASLAAKFAKIPIRVLHSHNFKTDNFVMTNVKKLARPLLSCLGTDFFACSMGAANWMFSSKVIKKGKVLIIKNGIEIKKFIYNEEIRQQYRKILGLEDKIVVGHVGRFQEQKNHKFLVDIFYKLYLSNSKYVLLLVGEGEYRKEVEQKIKKLKLDKNVIFLGARKDVEKLMQAMDIFLLPSLFEGLGIVAIESQASGLPTIVSNTLPEETNITKLIRYVPLKKPADYWAAQIQNFTMPDNKRSNQYDQILRAGYSIEDTAKWLENFYLNKLL